MTEFEKESTRNQITELEGESGRKDPLTWIQIHDQIDQLKERLAANPPEPPMQISEEERERMHVELVKLKQDLVHNGGYAGGFEQELAQEKQLENTLRTASTPRPKLTEEQEQNMRAEIIKLQQDISTMVKDASNGGSQGGYQDRIIEEQDRIEQLKAMVPE